MEHRFNFDIAEKPFWWIEEGVLRGKSKAANLWVRVTPTTEAFVEWPEIGIIRPYRPRFDLQEELEALEYQDDAVAPDLFTTDEYQSYPLMAPEPAPDRILLMWINDLPHEVRKYAWMFQKDIWWFLGMAHAARTAWANLLENEPFYCRALADVSRDEGHDPGTPEFQKLVQEVINEDVECLRERLMLLESGDWVWDFCRKADHELLKPSYDHKDLFFLSMDRPYREAFMEMPHYTKSAYILMNEQRKMPLFTKPFLLEVASSGNDIRETMASVRFVEELAVSLRTKPMPVDSTRELDELAVRLWEMFCQPLLETYGKLAFPLHDLHLGLPWSYVHTLEELILLCFEFKTLDPLRWISGIFKGRYICFVLSIDMEHKLILTLESKEAHDQYHAVPHWHPLQEPNSTWYEDAVNRGLFQGFIINGHQGFRKRQK